MGCTLLRKNEENLYEMTLMWFPEYIKSEKQKNSAKEYI